MLPDFFLSSFLSVSSRISIVFSTTFTTFLSGAFDSKICFLRTIISLAVLTYRKEGEERKGGKGREKGREREREE